MARVLFLLATLTAACGDIDASTGSGGATSTSTNTAASNGTTTTTTTTSANASSGISTGASGSTSAATGTGGGPGDLCAGYPSVLDVDLPWGNGESVTTGAIGGFAWDAVIAGRIVVPANAATGSLLGTMVVAEYQGPPTTRAISLSTSRCDFRDMTDGAPVDPTSAAHPMAWGFGNTASINFFVGPGDGSHPALLPGHVYYLNVQNYSIDLMGNSCTSMTKCDATLTVAPPNN